MHTDVRSSVISFLVKGNGHGDLRQWHIDGLSMLRDAFLLRHGLHDRSIDHLVKVLPRVEGPTSHVPVEDGSGLHLLMPGDASGILGNDRVNDVPNSVR